MPQKPYVTFKLGHEWFGINILLVREITKHSFITEVDHTPPYIKGIINLRGQLATILDLHWCLGRPQGAPTQNSRCIILKNAKELKKHPTLNKALYTETIGLTFDTADNILSLDPSTIQHNPSETSGLDERFVEGIVMLNNHLLTLLKVQEILSPEKTLTKLPA